MSTGGGEPPKGGGWIPPFDTGGVKGLKQGMPLAAVLLLVAAVGVASLQSGPGRSASEGGTAESKALAKRCAERAGPAADLCASLQGPNAPSAQLAFRRCTAQGQSVEGCAVAADCAAAGGAASECTAAALNPDRYTACRTAEALDPLQCVHRETSPTIPDELAPPETTPTTPTTPTETVPP
jgi:hypothetical protein